MASRTISFNTLGDMRLVSDIINKTLTSYNDLTGAKRIYTYMFASNYSLSTVTFPECRIIDQYAFYNCSQLVSASFPKCLSVTLNAFDRTSLSSIYLPDCCWAHGSITSSAVTLDMPNCIYYGNFPVRGCSELNLPAWINLNSGAYYSTDRQTYINMSFQNATFLSSGIFSLCINLQNLYIPYCEQIMSYAFYGCTKLSKLEVLNCYSFGSQNIFSGCSNLTTLYVQNLYGFNYQVGAFGSCSKLESIYIADVKPTNIYSWIFASTPISNSTYLGYYGSIYVPSKAVDIFRSSYSWSYYANRIAPLPEEFEARWIFANEYKSDSTITSIPESKSLAEFMGQEAFAYCSNLSIVDLPNCSIVARNAFYRCSNLTQITLASNYLHISPQTFAYCSNLSTIYLPGCSYIGTSAFLNCHNLQNIYASNCIYISDYAFMNCYSLTEIDMPNCRYVGSSAFWNCSNLSRINLPKLFSISGSACFQSCPVETINFPDCYSFGNTAFSGCSKLKYVNLPNASYGNTPSLFCYCYELELSNINYPAFKQTSEIPNYCFYYCSALKEVSEIDFPNCITIGACAFGQCTTLSQVTLPEVLNIYTDAFVGCYGLESIYLPKAKNLYARAFMNHQSLKYVNVENVSSVYASMFVNCYSLELSNIIYPALMQGSLIPTYCFYRCNFSRILSTDFPNCLSMSSSAFNNCSKLTTVEFQNCSYIDTAAFNSCFSLRTASFPNCSYIGEYAFNSCYSLVKIDCPNCEYIANAFSRCSSLQKVSFPKCNYLSGGAFSDCRKLESVYFLTESVIQLNSLYPFTNTPLEYSSYLGYYGSIYVKASLLQSFKTASYWSKFSDRFVGLTDEEIAALE